MRATRGRSASFAFGCIGSRQSGSPTHVSLTFGCQRPCQQGCMEPLSLIPMLCKFKATGPWAGVRRGSVLCL
jgi:hypothetical protein